MRSYAAASGARWARTYGVLLCVCGGWALAAMAGAWAFEKQSIESARATLADLESATIAHMTCSWSAGRIQNIPRVLADSWGRPGECRPATEDELAREIADAKQAMGARLSPVTGVTLVFGVAPFLIVLATRYRWMRRLRR